ncbi:MAG: response regulator [Deltaproteobacteria bacterium]|nr:response regulator [Deltaproteobacteria bacterium]
MTNTILIVDDEPNITMPLEFLLKQHGYRVSVATGGEEALEKIISDKPDLVLLDTMLPGIDGFEVCEVMRLNPKWKDIKIILLTAKGTDVNIATGPVLGADAYITKPFSNADIIENVKGLLEGIK